MKPMPAKNSNDGPPRPGADGLRNWLMTLLTLGFVGLYGTALTGWLKPLTDEKMVMRLEPIIFVIIGYYFGRLPSQQNEKTLKDEIGRPTQKADASQHAREQALLSREALEEKIKNVNAALRSAVPASSQMSFAEGVRRAGGVIKEESLRLHERGSKNLEFVNDCCHEVRNDECSRNLSRKWKNHENTIL